MILAEAAAADEPLEQPSSIVNDIYREGHAGMWSEEFAVKLEELPYQDYREIDRAAAANTVLWIKPLWATLGLGLTGLTLFIGSFFLPDLAEAAGLGYPGWLPWTRAITMLIGAMLIIIAAPAPITRDRIPDDPNDPPKPQGPPPLKSSRWK